MAVSQEAKDKYLEIKSLFGKLSNEIFKVVEYYYAWRTLTFSRSIAEKGKHDAEKNAETINLYKDFFVPVEQSLLNSFVIGLVNFFDTDKRSVTFPVLISKLSQSKDVLTYEVYKEMNPQHVEWIMPSEEYEPIKDSDIRHYEAIIADSKELIGTLTDFRHKRAAHTDIAVTDTSFIPDNVEKLIHSTQKAFNKLSASFESATTIWDHIERDTVRVTEFMLENLQRGETQRRKEFDEKHGLNN